MKTKLEAIGEIYGITRMENEDDEHLRERLHARHAVHPGTKVGLINKLNQRHRGSFDVVDFVTDRRRLTRWEAFKAFIFGSRFVYPQQHFVRGAMHVILWGGTLDNEENATEVWATIYDAKPVGILATLWINGKQFR